MKVTQRCYRRKLICLLGFVCLFLFVIKHFIKTMASAETFWRLGHKITRHDIDGSLTLGYRKFRSFFGISPVGCVAAWNNLFYVLPEKSHPEHLLCAFLHIKQYCPEHINSTLVGVSEKTFRKWCHFFVRLLAKMPVVRDKIDILFHFLLYGLIVHLSTFIA